MTDTVEPLVLDLLEWIAGGERSYAEVLDVWRTSCPRLPVWEEANDRGLVTKQASEARGTIVRLTAAGEALVNTRRRAVLRIYLAPIREPAN